MEKDTGRENGILVSLKSYVESSVYWFERHVWDVNMWMHSMR